MTAARTPAEPVADARWIASPDGPLMTWRSAPPAGGSPSGVLVLPPLGYQWWSTHRTLRTLAERLAGAGHLVARLDYHATGDSAGDQWEPGRVAAWRRSVAAAVSDLRAQGCERVSAVGVRLGATLALLDGAELGLDALAAWAPVVSGRRWAREQRMFATAVPDDRDPLGGGTIAVAGVVFAAQTITDVGALSATASERPPAARVLIADAAPDAALAEHLTALGAEVETATVADGAQALDLPTEDATVPEDVVATIAAWLGAADPGAPAAPPAVVPPAVAPSAISFAWPGGTVEETATRLGEAGFSALVTTAPNAAATGLTLLLLNTGSEPHVGPGRSWVELARTLALDGHTCVRADWRGWGESPDGGHAPGRPYDQHAVADTIALVDALRAEGHEHVVLVGLCASAWVALQAVLQIRVEGVVALNPQMYWEPGDPVEATIEQTRRRRADVDARIREGAADGRWDAEDEAGLRPWAARWLDDLVATAVPATLLFAEGDDGIAFLGRRNARRLADAIGQGLVVRELPEIDHPLHRTWTRPIAIEAIRAAVGPRS